MPRENNIPNHVSVIIPTLNEAGYLPRLLEILRYQTRPPDEIIVADAGSSNGTGQIARQAGVRVVTGGRPAVGRNAGAQVARGKLLLFLDADVLPDLDFLARILDEFEIQKLDVATCLIVPLSEHHIDRLLCEITNLFLQTMQTITPHAPGYCILVKRQIHQAIGGFDETVAMAEDHDYVQRASQYGAFGVLTNVRIPVSMRRLDKEGIVRVALKYLYCELYALAGRPVHSIPFAYEFGNYTHMVAKPRFVDVSWLREQLGQFENPLDLLSQHGLNLLEAMGSLRVTPEAFKQLKQSLLPDEVLLLRRYVLRRLAILRQTGPHLLQTLLTLFQEADLRGRITRLERDRRRKKGEEIDQEEIK